MRVLGAVVQIPALLVFDAGKQMALRDAVASQLVATINPRHILQSLQQSSEETLGSVGITPILNQNVEHDAGLIHRAPEIVLHAPDSDDDLIEVPLVPGPWRRRLANVWPNFLHQRRAVP